VPDQMLMSMPGSDWAVVEPYAVRLRFGQWDQMLEMAAPDARLRGLTGGYLYARALALAAKGRLDEARATLAKLQALAAAAPADAPAGLNTIQGVLGVAIPMVQARLALAEQHSDEAIALLQRAVHNEDQLGYNEPSDWFFPARHVLGAQLLLAHRAAEAEAVYRDDLKRNPANGWALYGLSAACQAQGKTKEAQQLARQFEAAWQHADIALQSSAFF